VVLRQEVVDVETPAAADLGRHRHVREGLEAGVTGINSSRLGRELLEGLRQLGVVPRHLGGFGDRAQLLDEILPEFSWQLCLLDT
jgi:hypothetical protein